MKWSELEISSLSSKSYGYGYGQGYENLNADDSGYKELFQIYVA